MPDRKERVWVTENISEALSTTAQSIQSLTLVFETKVGRKLAKGDTLSHTWFKGLWSQSAAGDSSAEQLAFGIGFYPSLMDAGDFPNVLAHQGDWQMHDSRGFLEPETLQTPMVPQQLATLDIESRGQRAVPKSGSGYNLFLVAQSLVAPSAGSFELRGSLTMLWLV